MTPSALTASDDPDGKAKSVENQWRVVHRISVGKVRGDGRVVKCHHLEIMPGDFVDVTVVADIETVGTKNATSKVHFEIQRVVRLQPAKIKVKVWCLITRYMVVDVDCNVDRLLSRLTLPPRRWRW